MNTLEIINFLIREVPKLQLKQLFRNSIYFVNGDNGLIYKVDEYYNIDLVEEFTLTSDDFSRKLDKKIKYELR